MEEKQYPALLAEKSLPDVSDQAVDNQIENINTVEPEAKPKADALVSGKHLRVEENQKGISYEKLFAPYLKDAKRIAIYDPYIRLFYKVKNLMKFLQMILSIRTMVEDIEIKLFTKFDDEKQLESEERLNQLKDSFEGSGIAFDFGFDQSPSFHARSIITDSGWKISLDRGLDIFQPYDFRNPFNLANDIQEERLCKAFEVTYLRE